MTTTPTPPLALPEPALVKFRTDVGFVEGFTATQMNAHATAAILSDRAGRGDAAGWVSVEDGLPAVNQQVLIAAWAWGDPARGERIYGFATYIDSADEKKRWVNDQDPDQDSFWYTPTHWTRIPPLPAAPTGEPS